MRTFMAAFITLALAGAASAQKPDASVHRLKNIAAADAAKALTTFADENKLPVTVVAEPVSNTVILAGATAPLQKVAEVLEKLDVAPPSVVVQAMILEAPAGFAADIGFEDGEKWVLMPREVRMLTALLHGAKEKQQLNVLSRPQVQVADNQTGVVELDCGGYKLAASVTPRITTNVLLRVDVKVTTTAAEVLTASASQEVPDGGTLVVRCSKVKDGEILVVLTPHRVK